MENNKILIVDDEPDILEVLKKRLESKGYLVFTAKDGVEGLKQAAELAPDLILLDIVMPYKDGFTMLRELRHNDSTREIPVIMVSAKGELGSIYQAEDLAATDYIIKPIDFDELLKYIKRYI